jgi:hypothetical protein
MRLVVAVIWLDAAAMTPQLQGPGRVDLFY